MKKHAALILSTLLVLLLILFTYILVNRQNNDINPAVDQTDEIEMNADEELISDAEDINNNETKNMEENKINKIVKENGLIIEVLSAGDGKEAKNGNTVAVHYTGKLVDGTVFDSSIQRGTPIEFNLGIGMVIPGWEQGILGMLVGEKRILTIPADLAYGARGISAPDGTVVIPGGATLVFDVELVDVK